MTIIIALLMEDVTFKATLLDYLIAVKRNFPEKGNLTHDNAIVDYIRGFAFAISVSSFSLTLI